MNWFRTWIGLARESVHVCIFCYIENLRFDDYKLMNIQNVKRTTMFDPDASEILFPRNLIMITKL